MLIYGQSKSAHLDRDQTRVIYILIIVLSSLTHTSTEQKHIHWILPVMEWILKEKKWNIESGAENVAQPNEIFCCYLSNVAKQCFFFSLTPSDMRLVTSLLTVRQFVCASWDLRECHSLILLRLEYRAPLLSSCSIRVKGRHSGSKSSPLSGSCIVLPSFFSHDFINKRK